MQVFCAIQPKEPLGGRRLSSDHATSFPAGMLDGLVALTSGLDNTSVSRLEQPYDALSLQAKESLHSLERTVGLSENRKALRASILSSWPPFPRVISERPRLHRGE
ncbi:hypothetical protein FocTR4_00011121, partial [Fusarium oxysporum f. sp. cubense]